MITYDKESKTLKFQKYDVQPVKVSIMRDLYNSYRKYVMEVLPTDVDYLFSKFSNENEEYTATIEIPDIEESVGTWTYVKDPIRYMPIDFRYTVTNRKTGQSYTSAKQTLLEMPVMDGMGRILTHTGYKAFLPSLRPLESASWDADTQTYNIALPKANISIAYTSSSTTQNVKIKGSNSKTVNLERLIQAMLYKLGDSSSVHEIYCSNTGRSIIHLDANTFHENLLKEPVIYELMRKFDPTNNFNGDMYNLGNARESLNEIYTLKNAIGETLSRDVKDANDQVLIARGTTLTASDITTLQRACINIIYVTDHSDSADGLLLANDFTVPQLPEYMPNHPLIQWLYPEYKDQTYLKQSIGTDNPMSPSDYAILIEEGTLVSPELFSFIQLLYSSYDFKDAASGKPRHVSFERPIIGNHMVQLMDLVDSIPSGRSALEWVYTYNNPTFEKTPDEVMQHITVHDFEAILGDICNIVQNGRSDSLLNRDDAFLKKLDLIHHSFSKYLRMTFDEMFKTGTQRDRYLADWKEGEKNKARGITNQWMNKMYADNILSPYTVVNLLDEVSMLTHANIKLRDVPDKMRHIAMPYFGRICCVETPSGKPLGIVNNLACGCHLSEDGDLLVPYYKIINKAGRPYLMKFDKTYTGRAKDKIHWLTPKDELNCKIVSLQDLTIDDHGFITNEYVLARVPNIDRTDPFLIMKVRTSDLVNSVSASGGSQPVYCTITPEQILSLAACTIPFIGADDATRVTYGLAQAKQAIYLKHTEKPRVLTSMYTQMLHLFDKPPLLSTASGTYEGLNDRRAYNAKVGGQLVPMAPSDKLEGKITQLQVFDAIKYVGEHVEKGEPLFRVSERPEPFNQFAIRKGFADYIGPFNCTYVKYINEWNCGYTPELLTGEDGNCAEYVWQNSRIVGHSVAMTNIKFWHTKEMNAGDLFKETTISRDDVYTPTRMALIAYIPYGYNHEDGVVITESCAEKYTSTTINEIKTPIPFEGMHRTTLLSDQLYPRKEGEVLVDIYPLASGKTEANKVATVYAKRDKHGIPLETYPERDNSARRATMNTVLLSIDKAKVGDKFSGRHGNKGVVSLVVPDSQAPQFLNGVIPDVILNPHGVPSRMNIGQILELHASFFATLTGIYINSDSFNGMTTAEVETCIHLLYDYSQWLKAGSINSAADLINKVNSIPEFSSMGFPTEFIEQMYASRANVAEWIDCFNRDGTARMYDPVTDTFYRTPITFGYAYYYKLEQEVDLKISDRGGPLGENYSFITQQPEKINGSTKGQKLGEMELVNLAAYGCSGLIEEALNEKSDNLSKSYNDHVRHIGLDLPTIPEYYAQPASVESVFNHLNALGVKVEADNSILPTRDRDEGKYTYSFKTAVAAQDRHNREKQSTGDVNDVQEIQEVHDTTYADILSNFRKGGMT